jgi:hypothetical protein
VRARRGGAGSGDRAQAQIEPAAGGRAPSPPPAAPDDGAVVGGRPWEASPAEAARSSPVAWNDALVLARQFIDYMHTTVDTNGGNMLETERGILDTEARMQASERELVNSIQFFSEPGRGADGQTVESLVVDARHVRSSADGAIRRAIAAAVGGYPLSAPRSGEVAPLPLLQTLCAAFTCHRLESEPVPEPYRLVFDRLATYFLDDVTASRLLPAAAAMAVTHFVNVGLSAGCGQVDLPVRRAVAMLVKHIATNPTEQAQTLMDTLYVRDLAVAASCCGASAALNGVHDTLRAFLRRRTGRAQPANGVYVALYRLSQCVAYAAARTGRDTARDMVQRRLTAEEMSAYKDVLAPRGA